MGPTGLVDLGDASREAQDVPAGTHSAHRAVTEPQLMFPEETLRAEGKDGVQDRLQA